MEKVFIDLLMVMYLRVHFSLIRDKGQERIILKMGKLLKDFGIIINLYKRISNREIIIIFLLTCIRCNKQTVFMGMSYL